MSVAGVMVLYNPKVSLVIDNCKKYIDVLEKIVCVDNTPGEKSYIGQLESIKNVVYIDLKDNKGLAYGQNRGCEWAYGNGYEYVLLLDQDSIFESQEDIFKLKTFAKNHLEYSLIAPNVKKIYFNQENEKKFFGRFAVQK